MIDSYYRNSFKTSNAYVKRSLHLGTEFLSKKGIVSLDMPNILMNQKFSLGSVDVLNYDYLWPNTTFGPFSLTEFHVSPLSFESFN
jgi:hypothetical protein